MHLLALFLKYGYCVRRNKRTVRSKSYKKNSYKKKIKKKEKNLKKNFKLFFLKFNPLKKKV